MNYCSHCRASVSLQIPEGDHRPRYVCEECGMIHYSNPKVVTGCLIEHDDKILLCKRDIEPRRGYWTLPAGFLENQETAAEGAIRETFEETRARVDIDQLFCFFDIPHISQIYLIYLARLQNTDFGPTPESSEVKLFAESEIPWDEIAFPVIINTLQHYYQSKKAGASATVFGLIDKRSIDTAE